MKTITSTTAANALWLSDLHLDRLTPQHCDRLLDQISDTPSDCIFITGDISFSGKLTEHLTLLASAGAPRPVYFVSGNHDYYGSSIAEVDDSINALCAKVRNLHHLDGRQIIPLTTGVCVIGDRGWADARAGHGLKSCIRNPDHRAIRDFRGLTREQAMIRMQEMGKTSARVIRRILPLALTRYRHVVLLTHTPPYPEAVRFNGEPCGRHHLPHYTNLSAGLAIRGITRAFPQRNLTILAGHAHHSSLTMDRNVCVRVAHARTGRTGPLEILRFS